jgi:hypothetical protein
MSFWSDLVKDISLGLQGAAGGSAGVVTTTGPAEATTPQQLASEAPGIGVIEGIWTQLKDGRMWRSLGWLLLAVLMIILGAIALAGPGALGGGGGADVAALAEAA